MRDASLAPQFVDHRQQSEAAQLGMWIFLSTEMLFFGGLLLLYYAYRFGYPSAFAEAAQHTDIVIGAANTALLLTSSFAVAWAMAAVKDGANGLGALLLLAAAVLGIAFLGLKSIEYFHEYGEYLVPGINFTYAGTRAGGVELFFVFYFVATGLHAIHLIIGILALAVMAWRVHRLRSPVALPDSLIVTGLYWHFVDIVWIFLFALIYLPGRNGS